MLALYETRDTAIHRCEDELSEPELDCLGRAEDTDEMYHTVSPSPHKPRSSNAPPVQLLPSPEHGRPCPVHEREDVTLQCTKCQRGICLLCAVGEHKTHGLLCLKGFHVAGQEQSLVDLEELSDRVSECCNYVGNLERDLVKRYSKYRTTITTWRDDIIALVTERARIMTDELNEQLEDERSECKESEKELAARTSVLRRIKASGQIYVDAMMGEEMYDLVDRAGDVAEMLGRIEKPSLPSVGQAVQRTCVEEVVSRHTSHVRTGVVHSSTQVKPEDLPQETRTRLPAMHKPVLLRDKPVNDRNPICENRETGQVVNGLKRKGSAFHVVGPQGESTKIQKPGTPIETPIRMNNQPPLSPAIPGELNNRYQVVPGMPPQVNHQHQVSPQLNNQHQVVPGAPVHQPPYPRQTGTGMANGVPSPHMYSPTGVGHPGIQGNQCVVDNRGTGDWQVSTQYYPVVQLNQAQLCPQQQYQPRPGHPPQNNIAPVNQQMPHHPTLPAHQIPPHVYQQSIQQSVRQPFRQVSHQLVQQPARQPVQQSAQQLARQVVQQPVQHQVRPPVQQLSRSSSLGSDLSRSSSVSSIPMIHGGKLPPPSGRNGPWEGSHSSGGSSQCSTPPVPPTAVRCATPQQTDRRRSIDEMQAVFRFGSPIPVPNGVTMKTRDSPLSPGLPPPPPNITACLSRPPTPGTPTYGPPPLSALSTPPTRVLSPQIFTTNPAAEESMPRPQALKPAEGDDEDPVPTLENKGIPVKYIETWEMTSQGEYSCIYPLGVNLRDVNVSYEEITPNLDDPGYMHVARVPLTAVVHALMFDVSHEQLMVRTSRGEDPVSLYSYLGELEGGLGEADAYINPSSGGLAWDSRRNLTLMVQAPDSLYQFSASGEYIGKINVYTAGTLGDVTYCCHHDLYAVTDTSLGRVWLIHPDLAQPVSFISSLGTGPEQLALPEYLTYDPRTGLLAVSDAGNDAVKLFSLSGQLRRIYGCDSTELSAPAGVCFDREGCLVVSDSGNKRVLRFWLENHTERWQCLLDSAQLEERVPWCVQMSPEGLLVVSTFSVCGKLSEYLDVFVPEAIEKSPRDY